MCDPALGQLAGQPHAITQIGSVTRLPRHLGVKKLVCNRAPCRGWVCIRMFVWLLTHSCSKMVHCVIPRRNYGSIKQWQRTRVIRAMNSSSFVSDKLEPKISSSTVTAVKNINRADFGILKFFLLFLKVQ